MKSRNAVISLFLLFVYAMSYSHNVVSHGWDLAAAENHHTHKHVESSDAGSKNDFIAQANHLDQNLYDLLICILSEVPQTEDNCDLDYYLPTKEVRNSHNSFSTKQFVAVVLAILVSDIESSASIYPVKDSLPYSPPPIDNTSSRGHPTIS